VAVRGSDIGQQCFSHGLCGASLFAGCQDLKTSDRCASIGRSLLFLCADFRSGSEKLEPCLASLCMRLESQIPHDFSNDFSTGSDVKQSLEHHVEVGMEHYKWGILTCSA
jgi:hypothetical protein